MHSFLSERLYRIASYVKPGSTVIDVGTDHAYIPIWLVKNKICDSVIATDINSGPLKKAQLDAFFYSVENKINFIQCDGLSGCNSDWADTIIIAGLGGDTIISILERAPWALEKRLILQTQSKHELLKEWFSNNELSIVDGSLVYENYHYYTVWVVQKGKDNCQSLIERVYFDKRDPLLLDYIIFNICKISKQIDGLKKSSESKVELISELEAKKQELISYQNEVLKWQQ